MNAFSPQFLTHNLPLNFKKGESAQFAVSITNFDLDLRNCLVFSEIRRSSPGYSLIGDFTGTISSGSNTISLSQYPSNTNKSLTLKLLPVRPGDLITLEGSGIIGSKVIAVTDRQIVASTTANRAINEGRLLVRSLSLASFTAVPNPGRFDVTITSTAAIGSAIINVSGVTKIIPKDTKLIFNDAGTAKIVQLSQVSQPNDTVLFVQPLAAEITAASVARIGASPVIALGGNLGATELAIAPLQIPIAAETKLNFASRTADGWVFVGSATLSNSVVDGVTSLPVVALSQVIPESAIAWVGTIPFNSFYLAIDPSDTQFLESGDYGYDVVIRQPSGYTIRVIQGDVKLTDHWSDGV